MIGVLWAYEGWQYATFSAGETLRPQRTFPLGIGLGTAALILLYCFANYAYIAALGPDEAALSNSIAATAVRATFGAAAGKLVAVAILVSIFSASNAVLLTAPRVFYAMARDGLFFRRLADVHPRFGTPATAIIATAAWAAVLAVSGTFDTLLRFVITTGWIFYALGAARVWLSSDAAPLRHRRFCHRRERAVHEYLHDRDWHRLRPARRACVSVLEAARGSISTVSATSLDPARPLEMLRSSTLF
jgi:APA family basic amino acid/polyamine antiporter